MSSRGSLGRPTWFELNVSEMDDARVMLLISELGLEAYGIHVMLRLYLAQQIGYRAPLSIVPALAIRNTTTQAKVEAVIKGYKLYSIIEDEGRLFFSPELTYKLEKFDKKCLENKRKGETSAKEKELKRLEKEKELMDKLSELGSTQPQFNSGSTEYKEKKEEKQEKESLSKEKKNEIFRTMNLKAHLIDKYNNTNTTWEGVAGYTSLSIRNGYLHNNVTGKDLTSGSAIHVWGELAQQYATSEGAKKC